MKRKCYDSYDDIDPNNLYTYPIPVYGVVEILKFINFCL